MRKGKKWHRVVWSQKGPSRGEGHKIDKEGLVQLTLLRWGARATYTVGVAGQMSRAGNEWGTFCCYMGVTKVEAGYYEIRDQNKDLKLSFVQGLLLTHYWGSCTELYAVDIGINKFLPSWILKSSPKKMLRFLGASLYWCLCPFHFILQMLSSEISPICSAEIICNDHNTS